MYRLDIDPEAQEQIAALPPEAVRALAEVVAVLELAPWNGDPQHESNPTAELRRWHFGPNLAGQIVYLILERRREVHVIMVQWFG